MKKTSYLMICCILVTGLLGCNSAKVDQLNDKMIQLQNEKSNLTKELESVQQESAEKSLFILELQNQIEAEKSMFDVTIEGIEILSDKIYQEGPAQGRLYGEFDVAITVRNQSQQDIENIKTTAKLETSNSNYAKSLNVKTTKLATLKALKAGEEKEIIFKGFRINHPDMIQELIINVVEHGEIKKVRILGAFPPGIKD